MLSPTREAEVWRAVSGDLRRVADSLRSSRDRAFHAPLHLRIAHIRLHGALLEDAEALTPRIADGAKADEMLPRLADALDDQLAGRPAERSVLEALPPGVRAAAAADITAAVQADPAYEPALQAAAALALVSGRWAEAVAWYERLVRHASDPVVAGAALSALGDVQWRRLGKLETARESYLEARAVLGDDPVLLDKLLKLELELERWPAAIETCRRLLQLLRESGGRPEAAVTYLLTLGEIHLYGLEDPVSSLGYYLEAISGAPAYDLAYTLMAELLESSDRAKLAAALDGDPGLHGVGGRLRIALEQNPGAVPAAMVEFRKTL